MILLDTHILIWMKEYKRRIPPRMLAAMNAESDLRVSPISFWEIAMLASKGRITLSDPVLPWLQQVLLLPRMDVLPITPEIGARSGTLEMRGDPADRIIAATALGTH